MAKVSSEASHISARNVGPLLLGNALDENILSDLAAVGIHISVNDVIKMAAGLGQDSLTSGLTTGSIATPVQFLQTWLPGFVKILMQARKIDELVGVTTMGNWYDEEIVQGVMELTGTATPYGDYTNVPLSSWNTNFERRTIVRFEEGLRVGKMEDARAAQIRVSSADAKREASALALEIQRNAIGFYGYNDGANRTYGFLNDPSLPAYVSFPVGASTATEWSTKTFLEITADIRGMVSALRTQSGDQIDPTATNTTLALATAVIDYLSVTNALGSQSVRQWLKETYPNMRVISAPELNAAHGGENVVYLYAESVDDGSTDDGRTFLQVVPAKFMTLGVEQQAKAYVEDFANATAGVMVKRPYAVVRRDGA
jgi:hypothetical protein